MKRLTAKWKTNRGSEYCFNGNSSVNHRELKKLGELEDVEEKLNLYGLEENQRCLTNFLRLILAEENGFYYKKDNEICFCRWCVRVGLQIVETKPCCFIKETTLKSCYYGDVEELKELEDAHYWDWKTCLNFHLKDYGKSWALTKEELMRFKNSDYYKNNRPKTDEEVYPYKYKKKED